MGHVFQQVLLQGRDPLVVVMGKDGDCIGEDLAEVDGGGLFF